MADAFLPVQIEDVPIAAVMNDQGLLKSRVRYLVEVGVVRVIAGPTACHVVIDIKRPYFRPVGKVCASNEALTGEGGE